MKIKKRIIEIEVNDEFITGSGVVIGAAGSHNDVVIRARFNENWVGLNIVAIFKDANGENPTAIPVVMSSVSTLKESDPEYEVHEFTVPFGVKKYEGRVSLAFLGYNVAAVVEDEELAYTEEAVMSSGTSYFNVLQSDVIMADDLYPEANPGQQLHKDVDTLGKMYGALGEALDLIKGIQTNLGSATITIADLGTLEANIKEAKEGFEELKDFLKYEHLDEQGEANMFDRIYPVGSIYMSVENTSPAELFGGAWERLQDKFLLGAGSYSETNGIKGGEAVHTLTPEEMPAHGHIQQATSNYAEWARKQVQAVGNSSLGEEQVAHTEPTVATNGTLYAAGTSKSNPVYTRENGGGGAHNNMPPYLAVYMWERTA
jgi:hypothetical protein